jgi:hypothetical protein
LGVSPKYDWGGHMADLAVTFSLVAVNTWTLSWYLAVVSVPTATF